MHLRLRNVMNRSAGVFFAVLLITTARGQAQNTATITTQQDEVSAELQNAESAAGSPDTGSSDSNGPATLEQIESGSAEQAPPPAQAEPEAADLSDLNPQQMADLQNDEGAVVDERREVQVKKICNCRSSSQVDYRDRRTTWGGVFGVQVGAFAPTSYQPDFVSQTFDQYYSASKRSPSVEVVFGPKWNAPFGSITAQIGAGFFQATNTSDPKNTSTLNIEPITVGAILALDTLFSEPYVVPYGGAGAYTDIYKESIGGLAVQGNTPVAPYFEVGVMLQVDHLDWEAHTTAYQDFGLENTFVYVEARSFLASSASVPNLSTPLQVAGGLKFEF